MDTACVTAFNGVAQSPTAKYAWYTSLEEHAIGLDVTLVRQFKR